MKMCIVRKAPYRLPGTSRLVWSIELAQNNGLSLLFVRSPDKNGSHHLTIATENAERIFESVNVSSFPIERSQMLNITATLATLGEEMCDEEIADFFKPNGLW